MTRLAGTEAVPQDRIADQLELLARTPGVAGDHDFAQLLTLAVGESGFKPHAHNTSTGATGPFQFVKSTWLSLVRSHGAELGIRPELIDQIVDDDKGKLAITDPATLKTVLGLRNDVALSTRMASKYLDDNKTEMTHLLHRAPSEGEVQLSFLLGPTGAARLIKTAAHAPHTPAAEIVPRAAAANRHLFFDKSGAPRSAAATIAYLNGRYHAQKTKLAAYVRNTVPDHTRKIDS